MCMHEFIDNLIILQLGLYVSVIAQMAGHPQCIQKTLWQDEQMRKWQKGSDFSASNFILFAAIQLDLPF